MNPLFKKLIKLISFYNVQRLDIMTNAYEMYLFPISFFRFFNSQQPPPHGNRTNQFWPLWLLPTKISHSSTTVWSRLTNFWTYSVHHCRRGNLCNCLIVIKLVVVCEKNGQSNNNFIWLLFNIDWSGILFIFKMKLLHVE